MSGALDDPAMVVALALLAGAIAQALAHHVKIPGIVLLLAAGVLLGPEVTGLVRPAALAGGLDFLVGFAVAVILFDGGLNLDLARLRRSSVALRRLVTLGAAITAIGASVCARLIMGWSWQLAALFGSLVIVTGPTVIGPLVRRLRIEASTAALLEAEGVLIDPVGAITAFVVLEFVLAPDLPTSLVSLSNLGLGLGLGSLVGLLGGTLLATALRRRRFIPEGLERAVTLAFVLFLYQAADALVHESGIAAVTVAGLMVRRVKAPGHEQLREFKEQLTLLMIGMLFVLLAADVRLADVHALGWAGLVTVLALMLVVRPACVLASAARSGVPWRQRIFLAWIGPRGIVAAAVASLFATRLDDAGVDGGAQLRALTFLVIAATVVTAGLTGGVVARWLGLRRASDDGWLIMGASPLARAIASSLADAGERSVLVDRNPEDCREAAALGLEVIHGNALEERTLERAYLDTRRGALALTRNDEVNLLFASRCRRLGKLRRLYVALSGAAQGVTAEIARKAGCELLGGRGLDVERWCQRITDGRAAFAWWILHEPGARSEASRTADDGRELVVPLLRRRGRAVAPVGDLRALAQGDVVRFVIDAGRVESARAQLRAAGFRELVDEPEAATRPAV